MSDRKTYRNKTRFLYAGVVTAICVLFLSCILVTLYVYNSRIDREKCNQQAAQYAEMVHVSLEELYLTAVRCASNWQLSNLFFEVRKNSEQTNYFDENVLDYIDVYSLLSSYVLTKPQIRIGVFNWLSDFVFVENLYCIPDCVKEWISSFSASDFEEKREPIKLERRDFLDFYETDPCSDMASRSIIGVNYPITNAYGTEVYGMVCVHADSTWLDEIFMEAGAEQQRVELTDEEGKVVYIFGEPTFSKKKSRVMNETSTITGTAVPDTDIFLRLYTVPFWKQKKLIYTECLIGGAMFLVWLLLMHIVSILADRIAWPLWQFCSSVYELNLDNLFGESFREKPGKEYTGIAEIEMLENTFHDLLVKLDKAKQLEINAHIQAVQAQMNPHFLYNILSVISAAAMEEEHEKVQMMCGELSRMLRYGADYRKNMVTLQEELEYTEHYLQLMKQRYEENFEFDLVYGENCKNIYVPKLSIQPLAENCFKHGFRNMLPVWKIKIVAETDASWKITVCDNGSGIPRERLAQIQHAAETAYQEINAGKYEGSLEGLGLINTILRMKLMFAEGFVFDIQADQSGTSVILQGPQRKGEPI